MPGEDRKGPMGDGPRTGRGLGRCQTDKPDTAAEDNREDVTGRIPGRGQGRGQGAGRGFGPGAGGGRGRGRGPGRGRFGR